jgi:hypothetical protein
VPVKIITAAPAEWPAHLPPVGAGAPPGSRNAVLTCECGHCHTCHNRERTRQRRANARQSRQEAAYGVEA